MRWLLCLLLFAAPVLGQRAAGSGRAVRGTVTAEYAEVLAGPGEAYVSRGRVYGGDPVEILQRGESGEWLEVRSGGVQGWVRARLVKVARGGAVRDAEGRVDVGRDRRTRGYGYDERGRRVRLDGTESGSGEGTQGSVATSPRTSAARDEAPRRVELVLGAAQLRRVFSSDIAIDSALRALKASGTGYGVGLEAAYLPLRYVGVRGLFRTTQLAEVTLPASEELGLARAADVGTSAQEAELDAIGRYPFGDGWAGGYVGGRLLRHAFQETEPFPVFLTNTFLSVAAGATGGWRFGPVGVGARAGVLLPLSVSQDPEAGGDASGFGLSAAAHLAWHLHPHFAVVGQWHLQRIETDFEGASTHVDTHEAEPAGYTLAKETDTVHGGGLGVRWTP